MPTVNYQGKDYNIGEEADQALCDLGPNVASREMTGEEAVRHILTCEGYKDLPEPGVKVGRRVAELPSTVFNALERAMSSVLGSDVYEAMKAGNAGRTNIHRAACEKAFTYDLQGADVETIRLSWRRLSEVGQY